MNETRVQTAELAASPAPTGPLDRMCRASIRRLLDTLEHGEVSVQDDAGRATFGRCDETCDLRAAVRVRSSAVYRRMALGGFNGLATAFIDDLWTCDDLTALFRIFLRNTAAMIATDGPWSRVATAIDRVRHALRRNTQRGSRRNIADHYDLSNEFFALLLDETMTYSAGIFERPDATLKDASIAKYDRLCRKLDLGPDTHVLEIGAGWGGFAIHAAGRYGCRVTTTTVSREQFALARERIAAAGLKDRVTLLLEDYRDLRGEFDRLVSIEMIEAVGHQYLPDYFGVLSARLKPNGLAAVQAITIADQHYDRHRRTADFIKRFIFPGSCIPSLTALSDAMTRASDLRLVHLEDITPHYAATLRHWHDNLMRNVGRIHALGLGDDFLRLWRMYLCYCEAGFAERYLGSVQLLYARPGWRGRPILPPLS